MDKEGSHMDKEGSHMDNRAHIWTACNILAKNGPILVIQGSFESP